MFRHQGANYRGVKNNKDRILYTLTRDASLDSAGQDPCGTYTVTGVFIHNTENINNCELVPEEAYYCMVFLSQRYGFGLQILQSKI